MRRLLLLLLLTVAGSVDDLPIEEVIKQNCVRTCDCSPTVSTCNVTSPHDWPAQYVSTTKNLTIRGKNLGRVEASHLGRKGVENVEYLNLSNCQITSIDEDAFQGFPLLKELDLSQNNISGLKLVHFANLDCLNHINMSGNNDYAACHKLAKQFKKVRDKGEVKVTCGKIHTTPTIPTSTPKPTPTPTPTLTPTSTTPLITASESSTPNDRHPVTEVPHEDQVLAAGGIAGITVAVIGVFLIIAIIIDYRFFGVLSGIKARVSR